MRKDSMSGSLELTLSERGETEHFFGTDETDCGGGNGIVILRHCEERSDEAI